MPNFLAHVPFAFGRYMQTTIDALHICGSSWLRCYSPSEVLMSRRRRYSGRLSTAIPNGVKEGPDRLHEMLLCNLRLTHIYRRRMMRYETMDRHGCVAIAIEVLALLLP